MKPSTRYDENYDLATQAWYNAAKCGVPLPIALDYAWCAVWHHPNAERRPVVVLATGNQAAFLLDTAGGCSPDLPVTEAWHTASALFPLSVVPDVLVIRPRDMRASHE
jgi:hypothetical protein